MKPDYTSPCGTVTLYRGDCLAVLPTLEAGSVDAVVTDPPYLSGGQFRSEKVRPTNEKYTGWSQGENGESRKPSAFYSAFSGDNKDTRLFMSWSKEWMVTSIFVAAMGTFSVITRASPTGRRDGYQRGATSSFSRLPKIPEKLAGAMFPEEHSDGPQ